MASTSSSRRRKTDGEKAGSQPAHTLGAGPCCPYLGRRCAHPVVGLLSTPRASASSRASRSPIRGRSTCTGWGSTRPTARSSSPPTPASSGSRPNSRKATGSPTATRTRWASRSSARPFSRLRAPGRARAKLPPLLGLIESTDAGKTWEPISLLGEADFHVLRSAGKHVYGYDASNDRLLAEHRRGAELEENSRSPRRRRSSTSPRTRATRQQLVVTARSRRLQAGRVRVAERRAELEAPELRRSA